MKCKKAISAIILAVAVLAIVAYSLIGSIAKKPTVTEAEFPFSITYELDGETVTINDVYKVRYDRNDGYADTKGRVYVGEIGTMGEDNTVYVLKKGENTRIELWTYFYPDYMMGDSEYEYFDGEELAPRLYYYDAQEQEYSDEETLAAQGVKLISYEYPTPIENSLVFSHLSYFSSEVVLPTLLIAVLALFATLAFVKKSGGQGDVIDRISAIVNFVVGLVVLPFVTLCALLVDINGGGPEFYYQAIYFLPAFIALCIAASIALRRQGKGKKSLIACLVGPAAFLVLLIVCGIFELL